MKLNWDKIEEENKSQYKNYAPEGKHTTKVESVEVVTASTGNKGIRLNLAENDDYKFPKYGHTFYNSKRDSWRQHHMKECFVTLGFTEDQAKKAVEQCEDADDVMDAYAEMFKKALPKQKPFEVEVFIEYPEDPDDKYPTWDFAREEARLTYPKKGLKNSSEPKESEPLADAEDATEEISMEDIPF